MGDRNRERKNQSSFSRVVERPRFKREDEQTNGKTQRMENTRPPRTEQRKFVSEKKEIPNPELEHFEKLRRKDLGWKSYGFPWKGKNQKYQGKYFKWRCIDGVLKYDIQDFPEFFDITNIFVPAHFEWTRMEIAVFHQFMMCQAIPERFDELLSLLKLCNFYNLDKIPKIVSLTILSKERFGLSSKTEASYLDQDNFNFIHDQFSHKMTILHSLKNYTVFIEKLRDVKLIDFAHQIPISDDRIDQYRDGYSLNFTSDEEEEEEFLSDNEPEPEPVIVKQPEKEKSVIVKQPEKEKSVPIKQEESEKNSQKKNKKNKKKK